MGFLSGLSQKRSGHVVYVCAGGAGENEAASLLQSVIGIVFPQNIKHRKSVGGKLPADDFYYIP